LGKIDRENVNVSHVLLLLQRTVAPVRHHTMPGEGGIHPISSHRKSITGTPSIRFTHTAGQEPRQTGNGNPAFGD
ncbi:hypothetical protein, partial [Sphingomonas sp.]|uniref:hypothetical protein n=1 Tax=Sphingomonas sp. TaxID=28214 RepID=UPI003D6D1687